MLTAMSHRSGSRTPSYPVAALVLVILSLPCRGDLAALRQQDWPFHTSQLFEDDIDFGVGQLKTLNLGLGDI